MEIEKVSGVSVYIMEKEYEDILQAINYYDEIYSSGGFVLSVSLTLMKAAKQLLSIAIIRDKQEEEVKKTPWWEMPFPVYIVSTDNVERAKIFFKDSHDDFVGIEMANNQTIWIDETQSKWWSLSENQDE